MMRVVVILRSAISPAARFQFLGFNECFFHERAQVPQDLPCHSVCYVFAVALEAAEIGTVSLGLRPPEYRPGRCARCRARPSPALTFTPLCATSPTR
jgi:hypothetical protein